MVKRLFKIGLGFLILFVLAIIVFIILYQYTQVIDKAALRLTNIFVDHQINIKYQDLSGNFFTKVRIKGLRVTRDQDTLYVQELFLKYNVKDVLKGHYKFSQIVFVKPEFIYHSFLSPSENNVPAFESDTTSAPIDLENLPNVEVKAFIIKDGRGRFFLPSGTEIVDGINLEWNFHISPQKIVARTRYFKGDWTNRNLKIDRISFLFSGNERRIQLNQLEVITDNVQFYGHGEVDFKPKFRMYLFADTSTVTLAAVREFYPAIPFHRGWIKFAGHFLGVPDKFKSLLSLNSIADSLQVNDLQLAVIRNRNRFQISSLKLKSNFGEVEASGVVNLNANHQLKFNFRKIDLHKIGLFPSATNLNGRFVINFNSFQLRKLAGWGRLYLNRIKMGQMKIDSVKINIKARKGILRFAENSEVFMGPSSKFSLLGTLSTKGSLNVQLKTTRNRLDTLFARLGMPGFKGIGKLSLAMSGLITNPNMEISAEIDTFHYRDFRTSRIRMSGLIQKIVRQREGHFTVQIASGSLRKFNFNSGIARFRFTPERIWLDSLTLKKEEDYLGLKGSLALIPTAYEVKLTELRLNYRGYQVRNEDDIHFTWKDDSIKFQKFGILTTGNGQAHINGILTFRGNSDLLLRIENISLLPFNPFFRWEYEIGGLIFLNVRVTGSMSDPRVETEFKLTDLQLNEDRLGDVRAKFLFGKTSLYLQALHVQFAQNSYLKTRGSLQLNFKTEGGFQILPTSVANLSLLFNRVRLEKFAFLLSQTFPFSGEFNGKISLHGKLDDPGGEFQFTGNQMQIFDYPFPYFSLRGSFEHKLLKIEPSLINFANTEIHLSGLKPLSWNIEKPGDLFKNDSVQIKFWVAEDSLNFLGVLNEEVDRLIGDIKISGQVSGRLSHPVLENSVVSVQNGILYLYKLENPITNIEFLGHQEGPNFIIDKFRGRSYRQVIRQNFLKKTLTFLFSPFRKALGMSKPGGEIEGKGQINLADVFRPKFDLSFRLNKVYLNYFLENARLIVSSDNLTVTGRDTITVRGDVNIHEGDVEIDFTESEKNTYLSSSIRIQPPFIQYFLNVTILGGFYVRSEAPFNSFDIQLIGNLKIIQEIRSELEVYGVLEILKGKYFVQVEEFDVQAGKIEFVNPKELPEINLIAQKRKYDLRFDLNVRGRLNNPVKEIHIYDERTGEELYYPDVKDQMALLMFGVTFAELTSEAKTALVEKGQEVLTRAIVSQIEREARHFTGLDQIRIEKQYMEPELIQGGATGQLSSQYLALGKYLTSNIYLEYRTRLANPSGGGIISIPTPQFNWEPGNQIYLEYRISRHWAFSTLYRKTLLGSRVKFDVSWRINF